MVTRSAAVVNVFVFGGKGGGGSRAQLEVASTGLNGREEKGRWRVIVALQ